jgi:hypothetical protein
LEATETKYISLEKLILMELEINRRNVTNRVMTSFTLVANSADSPESILRPWPATDHEAEKLEV